VDVAQGDLALPAARGTRVVALRLLDDANTAATALAAGDSDSALHDFRVAVRRLRSWLRAFDDELHDAVPGKARRKLKALASATNGVRDREVQHEWLQHAGGRRGPRKSAATWLERFFSAGADDTNAEMMASVARDFPKARDALTHAFTGEVSSEADVYDASMRSASPAPPTLGEAIADRIGPHLFALHEAAAHIHTVSDEAAAHEARIAAKRLRYLIEPAREVDGAAEMLTQLRALQDALGGLHDGHVMTHELRRVLGKAAKREARRASASALGRALVPRVNDKEGYADVSRIGLVSLMKLLRREIHASFADAERLLGAGPSQTLAAEAARLDATLRALPSEPASMPESEPA
jgi:CHAD domain-containing protein